MRAYARTALLTLALTGVLASPALAQSRPAPASDPDEIVVAGTRSSVDREDERMREAIAYSNPVPYGAPLDNDYALVAWCEARVAGHVALGETLNTTDELDLEIMRLGRLEMADFRTALTIGRPRQSAATMAEAQAAAEHARTAWLPYMDQPLASRSEAYGMFMGIPGRCEHAARRVRNNITTPPLTPADVGLEMPQPEPAPAAADAPTPAPAA